MATFSDFYQQINQANEMISNISFNTELMNCGTDIIIYQPINKITIPPKEIYFDDLIMSNVLSFIPKYEKKHFKFEELETGVYYEVHKSNRTKNMISFYEKYPQLNDSVKFVKINKITPKFITFDFMRNNEYSHILKYSIYHNVKQTFSTAKRKVRRWRTRPNEKIVKEQICCCETKVQFFAHELKQTTDQRLLERVYL